MDYEVWMEGHAATGEHSTARFLGVYNAPDFEGACDQAVASGLNNEVEFYNKEKMSFWGCKFFPNEKEARVFCG